MDIEIIEEKMDIEIIEKKMLALKQAECPIIHSFGPGVYIRELRMKAGVFAIGHEHKFEHTNVLIKGKILLLNNKLKTELSAPFMFVSQPGRKLVYVLEDTVWLNIFATTETDIEILEATYFKKSKIWKENAVKIKNIKRLADTENYKKFISSTNLTEPNIRKQTENDQIPMPYGSFKISILKSKSNIEGQGVFATANICSHEIIAPVRLEGKRTPVGRFINHSITPNAKMELIGTDIYLIALNEIIGCTGGNLGNEITINYQKNIKLIGGILCQQ